VHVKKCVGLLFVLKNFLETNGTVKAEVFSYCAASLQQHFLAFFNPNYSQDSKA